MGLFDHTLEQTVKIQAETIKKQVTEIIDLNRELQRVYRELIHCIRQHQKPNSVKLAYNFHSLIKIKKMSDANLSFPGPTVTGSPVLTDIVTGQPVSPVVYHDGVVSNPDPTIATVTLNPDGSLSVVPLREGTITVQVNTLADFTNSLGVAVVGATVPSDPFLVIVTAAPVADGVKLSFVFA